MAVSYLIYLITFCISLCQPVVEGSLYLLGFEPMIVQLPVKYFASRPHHLELTYALKTGL